MPPVPNSCLLTQLRACFQTDSTQASHRQRRQQQTNNSNNDNNNQLPTDCRSKPPLFGRLTRLSVLCPPWKKQQQSNLKPVSLCSQPQQPSRLLKNLPTQPPKACSNRTSTKPFASSSSSLLPLQPSTPPTNFLQPNLSLCRRRLPLLPPSTVALSAVTTVHRRQPLCR